MQTFREIQKLLNKTSGRVIGDVMTPKPLVVRETTNLDAAARYVQPIRVTLSKAIYYLFIIAESLAFSQVAA